MNYSVTTTHLGERHILEVLFTPEVEQRLFQEISKVDNTSTIAPSMDVIHWCRTRGVNLNTCWQFKLVNNANWLRYNFDSQRLAMDFKLRFS